ncbi:hypothetical protein PCASD_14488 [Puccinia coronata f. sp. avenae]|uniref:Aminotransferase class I/classII large domain-containing protein n=1 Tax=Puccinia coronata f. sp. avenae TaxID=200324 RepID=A0A2N5U8I6_9BASI|nr:hypothetical protein PCASD_14488 [Puccinia coronata f. sp. avenae]
MTVPPKRYISDFMKEAAKKSIDEISANHYSIPKGRVNLRKAISEHYSESFHLGRANFGIYAALLSFCSKDDEVILIEPFFDQCEASPQIHFLNSLLHVRNVTFCGGKPVYVPLRPPAHAGSQNVSSKDWKLDMKELKAALTPKSKVIIINTPHNPVGKVFTVDELNAIGKLAEERNLFIIADEVYDCLTFDEPHVRIGSLSEGLWKRTVTVGSAGKSFAATGWRIGWCIGPAEILRPITAAMTRITFCSVSPLQEALATGFQAAKKENFFETQCAQYQARRDLLLRYLDQLGLPYTVPDGSYFVLVETSKVKIPASFEILSLIKTRSRDWHMCWFVAKVAGVVCIPPSDFYSSDHVSIGENFIRIAFCKDLELRAPILACPYNSTYLFSSRCC